MHHFYDAYERAIINFPNAHRAQGMAWVLFPDCSIEWQLQENEI